jgi:hypothetical protein
MKPGQLGRTRRERALSEAAPELEQKRARDGIRLHAAAAKARIAELKREQQVKSEDKDDVECSVFAPARPQRGRAILVQVLLHQAEQLATAVRMATGV